MTDEETAIVARYIISRLDDDTKDALTPGNKGSWRGAFGILELLGLIEEVADMRFRYTAMGKAVRAQLTDQLSGYSGELP